MRFFLLLCLMLTGCSTPTETPEKRTYDFYQFYLNAVVTDSHEDNLDSANMHDYVAQDTLTRLKKILSIYEQEITDSDYFTYTQDYAADWIPALKVNNATDYSSGKVVDVYLGVGSAQVLHLNVYLRREDNQWKIYRVRDASNHFEQPIFDDHAIAAAERYASTITPP